MLRWWNSQRLNFKVAVSIAITMVLALGVVLGVVSQHIRARLWQSEVQKGESLNLMAEAMLEDAMMAGRKDKIQEALELLGQSVGNRQLNSIAVYDDQYILTAFASGFPGSPTISKASMPDRIEDPSCWSCHQYAPDERPSNVIVMVEGNEVIRNSVPLYNKERCQTCHGTGQRMLGDIIVDYSQAQFRQSYNTILIGLAGGILIAIVFVTIALFQFIRRIVLNPIGQIATTMERGVLEQQVEIVAEDEIGVLARTYNRMAAQLRELIGSLEQRVADRTRALQASSDVSYRLSTLLNLNDLVKAVVDEIQQAFDYYHVHIYLFDDRNENLLMMGGTGEAGQALLGLGHRVARGKGLVGRAAEMRRPILVTDTAQDPSWLPNPLLPETRAEVAVPILLGAQVLGVLDVQQNRVGGLGDQDVQVLQAIANQVAIAVQNARAYSVSQAKAEREAMINTISQKIQMAESIDEVLRVALVELSQALQAGRASIELTVKEAAPHTSRMTQTGGAE